MTGRPGPPSPPTSGGGQSFSPQEWGAGGAVARGADLHTHSNLSDGLLTPAALVREAARRRLRAIALTDHDTVGGLAEATLEAGRLGIEVVPGVELSTSGQGGAEIHLLGYFVDPTDPALLAGLADYARARLVRMERMVKRLNGLGLPVALDHVRRLAGPGTLGRPHLARALVELGYAADLRDAFDRYLASGRPGFVPRPKVEPEQGIALILGAGGVPTLAHPLSSAEAGELDATLARLVPAGLRGLEVDYGEYDDDSRSRLRATAERWGLIATGGSDYHGPGFRAGRELGEPPVPIAVVERLRAARSGAGSRVSPA